MCLFITQMIYIGIYFKADERPEMRKRVKETIEEGLNENTEKHSGKRSMSYALPKKGV